jgi:hypothetical protein
MKNCIVLLAVIMVHSISYSQTDETRPHELGLRFSGINFNGNNNFNLVYKKQKDNPLKYKRYRFILANISTGDVTGIVTPFFALGGAIGGEKRKSLNDKFKYIHGWDLSGNYNFASNNNSSDSHRANVSLGYVVGFQYDISKEFCLNLEAIPAITNSLVFTNEELQSSVFNVTLNNQVAFSVFYKF